MVKQVPVEACSAQRTCDQTVAEEPVYGAMGYFRVVQGWISVFVSVFEQLPKGSKEREKYQDPAGPD